MSRSASRYQCLAALLCCAAFSQSAYAEHQRILPAPREVHYSDGSLELGKVTIHLDANPDEDDRFNAETLANCLQLRGADVVIGDSSVGVAIMLRRTGASDPLPMPNESVGSQSREAYTIHIDAKGAEVSARSSAGVYEGVQTLCQMVEAGARAALPVANVTDWPAMAYRATMVDFSEGQLLKLPEVERQIDVMAQLKMNQYYLYNELTIALDDLPPAAPGARMSKEDVRTIIAYARKRHIDVVPCLELYGHLHDLFRREEYSDLADFPHGVEFDPTNPKVKDLLRKWAAEYMDLFPSSFVHIGFDETWQLQQAASHGAASPASYFVQQLRNVSRLFEARGKTVLAWGDIMVRFPDIVPQLPKGLIAIAWCYDSQPDPAYHEWIDPLAARHQAFMVAPGVNAWSEIAPDFRLTFDNIDTMLEAGRKAGAIGVVNTIWSDDVQALKRPMLPGIAYGAAAAWQAAPADQKRFFKDYAALLYPGAPAQHIAEALEALAESESALEEVLGRDTMAALWHNPFTPQLLSAVKTHAAQLRICRLKAETAEEQLLAAEQETVDKGELNALLVESRMLDYAGMKYQYANEIADAWNQLGPHPTRATLDNDFDNIVVSQQHGKLPDLMEGITELKPQYKQSWLDEYTSYRLESALGRWDAEYEFWRRLQVRCLDILDSYQPGTPLPSWQSLVAGQ